MFIVLLKFSTNRHLAAQFMDDHKEWLKRGFDDGVFHLSGSIHAGVGGAILAHGLTRPDLESRINMDPFVVESIVNAELIEIAASRSVEQLSFMLT